MPQPVVKPTVIEPIVVPADRCGPHARSPRRPVAEASAPTSAPAADVPECSHAADAAAFAVPTSMTPRRLASAGEEIEGYARRELASPPLGNAPSQVETEGDARNSPMV
jgi:hypothetical protein